MYSWKNVLELYLINYFWAKNGVYSDFKPKSAGNRLFLARFCIFLLAEGLFASFTSSTTIPCLGAPPPIVSAPGSFWAAFTVSSYF